MNIIERFKESIVHFFFLTAKEAFVGIRGFYTCIEWPATSYIKPVAACLGYKDKYVAKILFFLKVQ